MMKTFIPEEIVIEDNDSEILPESIADGRLTAVAPIRTAYPPPHSRRCRTSVISTNGAMPIYVLRNHKLKAPNQSKITLALRNLVSCLMEEGMSATVLADRNMTLVSRRHQSKRGPADEPVLNCVGSKKGILMEAPMSEIVINKFLTKRNFVSTFARNDSTGNVKPIVFFREGSSFSDDGQYNISKEKSIDNNDSRNDTSVPESIQRVPPSSESPSQPFENITLQCETFEPERIPLHSLTLKNFGFDEACINPAAVNMLGIVRKYHNHAKDLRDRIECLEKQLQISRHPENEPNGRIDLNRYE